MAICQLQKLNNEACIFVGQLNKHLHMKILLIILLGIIITVFQGCKSENRNETIVVMEDQKKDTLTPAKVDKEMAGKSIITCPKCGFKKSEVLPTEICQLKYTCSGCNAVLLAKEGDCCVFCTYGDKKCPSKQ